VRSARTRAGLLTRLERLECRMALRKQPILVGFGYIKRLPPEYQGEPHIAVARQLPNQGAQQWVEDQERPGPDPPPGFKGSPDVLDIWHRISSKADMRTDRVPG
jgi:hypothetical protein